MLSSESVDRNPDNSVGEGRIRGAAKLVLFAKITALAVVAMAGAVYAGTPGRIEWTAEPKTLVKTDDPIAVLKNPEEVLDAEYDAQMAVLLKGPVFYVKHLAALLRKSDNGSVVNISSASALISSNGYCPYGLAKAAIATAGVGDHSLDHALHGQLPTVDWQPKVAFDPPRSGSTGLVDEDAIVILDVFSKKTRATPKRVIETR